METLTPLNKNQITAEYTVHAIMHRHSDWELTIFIDGQSVNRINGTAYDAPANRLFILGPVHSHAIIPLKGNHKHRDIYIHKPHFENIIKTLFSEELLRHLNSAEKPLYFDMPAQLVSELLAELSILDALAQIKDTETIQRQIADSVVVFILGYYLKTLYIQQKSWPDWFLQILKTLQQPEVFSLRIKDIIALTGYSHSQFSAIFKKYMNITLLDFISKLRLDYAAMLLGGTEKSVLDISYTLGYNSVSFFITQFKKRYGITPLRYRKNPELARHETV